MATIILRVLFLLVASGVAVLIFNSKALAGAPSWVPWGVLGGMIAGALAIIGIDISLRRKDLTVITAVYFGLLIGVFVTYIALLALAPFLPTSPQHPSASGCHRFLARCFATSAPACFCKRGAIFGSSFPTLNLPAM